MKKNPGRKERRLLERQNRRAAGRTIAVMNERRQKASTRKRRSFQPTTYRQQVAFKN